MIGMWFSRSQSGFLEGDTRWMMAPLLAHRHLSQKGQIPYKWMLFGDVSLHPERSEILHHEIFLDVFLDVVWILQGKIAVDFEHNNNQFETVENHVP